MRLRCTRNILRSVKYLELYVYDSYIGVTCEVLNKLTT